ncbi:MAG: TonB-dependent receptor [Prolixibacteraceae bacterium]|nr:TonB-dependent receptor [Prolixibacteraceae bacterium]
MKRLSILLLLQLMVIVAWGQYTLEGVITGNGEPLPGASVVIKNTYYGVSSGTEGRFQFKNIKKGEYILAVSFIGYESQEIKVAVPAHEIVTVELKSASIMTDEVLVSATLAGTKTPVAYTNLSGEEIAGRNMGQDIPYLLQLTPSFVTTSDAGTGIGYTNFRVRGTDMNRINITMNGIPLNDAESHGTWFVDQPDLASSLENVQIQRGVGTSSNGAAAFGATINLRTNTLIREPVAEYKTATGSFNTFKNTISASTGLLNDHWAIDARLSKISSDGYVDRAFSDLKSFYLSGGYYSENTIIKGNIISGIEKTYQSWQGVPSVRLNNDMEGMQRYEEHEHFSSEETNQMINSDSRTYNYYTYDNQIDLYQQDHYQLHISHKFNSRLNLNTSLHYTRGKGYYENYKSDEDLEDYQISPLTIGNELQESSDIIYRKWLDNYFYGLTFSLNYQKGNGTFVLGGGWNTYDGDHYGNVIWTEFPGEADFNHEYYRNNGLKKDLNIFGKYNYNLSEVISLFADLQYRQINYELEGIDDDLRNITQAHNFNFFNPKAGVFIKPAVNHEFYLSFSTANREPNRTAYIDANPAYESPVNETLHDWEAGYRYSSSAFTGAVNVYYMSYNNQLILTGEINDTGNPMMVNIDDSYRQGIELQSRLKITPELDWKNNITLSRNKIKNFTEFVDNWDTGEQSVFEHGITDIAFSPGMTANSTITFEPLNKLYLSLISTYVGKQYIDNSSDNERSLDAYFVNNLKADYSISTGLFREITFHLMVNNLLNESYESNAWVYSYILGGQRYKIDGYFPQAGRHFMVGVDLKF